MIELSPQTAIMLYLCGAIGVVIFLWIRGHFKSRSKAVLPPQKRLNTCEYCCNPYLSDLDQNVTECPKCRSLNRT